MRKTMQKNLKNGEEMMIDQTKEMQTFCKDNNLVWFYSGGGCIHYQVSDWLINLHDDGESNDLPTNPSDICVAGLWYENIIESYYESINKDINWDIGDALIKHFSESKHENVNCDNGYIFIEKMKLIDMMPIINKVNKDIKKFLDINGE